jgi:adenosylhomocysteine nucleosidase
MTKMEPLVQTLHRPLGIVAALHDELHELLAATQNKLLHRIGGREFWSGDLQGHRVVLVQCRVGKVAAAATTVALISHFHVRKVVLTGVAGGIAPHVAVGDVVISTQLLQHDVDASPLFPRWEVPLTGLSRFPSDPALVDGLAHSAGLVLADLRSLLGQRTLRDFAIQGPKVHTGLVVSGDRFVATTQECHALRSALPEALAVEMEGAAIAQVCHEWGVPFVAIRAISDRADDSADVDFSRFVAEVGAKYGAGVVQRWLSAQSAARNGHGD